MTPRDTGDDSKMSTTRTQEKYKVTLHWRDGKVDEGEGWGTTREAAAANAMNSMGYGGGSVAALDYWDAKLEAR